MSGALRWVLGAALLLSGVLAPPPAQALTPEEAQRAELEKLRQQVAGEVQLTAYNLLDELVYHWISNPPFETPTPVFLADVTVPVGMGTGLGGLLENHLTGLLMANPTTGITLSACPSCTAVTVHAGPEGTVVSRGIDNPEALERIGGMGGRHGLYLDFAAEGAFLVLRARITKLTPDLPIVWSRTISSAVGAPSLLRHPKGLKSAEAAREEYLDALNDRLPISIPIKVGVRAYASNEDAGVAPAPIIWIQSGVEAGLTQAHRWTGSLVVGWAWLPQAYEGFMAEARVYRLLFGNTRSLTRPDLYMFLGGAVMTLDGTAIVALQNNDNLNRASFGGLQLGLDFRVGNRFRTAVFLENMPAYNTTDRIGEFLTFVLPFHSLGFEVTFCF